MGSLFSAKVRHVGTSLGILIPKEIIVEGHIKEGQEIEVSVLKKNLKLIRESFGMDRDAKFGFERDREDRLDRWEKQKEDASG